MAWISARRLPSGHQRLYIYFWLDGKKRRISARGNSMATARRIKAKIETQIAEGRILDRQDRSRWTLGELARVYLPRMTALKPKSAVFRAERMKELLRVLGEDLPIEDISIASLERFTQIRLAEARFRAAGAQGREKVSPATVNRDIAILRHALRQAYSWRAETGLSAYRLADWKPLSERRPKNVALFLSAEEIGRILAAAAEIAAKRGTPESRWFRLVVWMAAETGARLGEIAGIRAEDLRGQDLMIRTAKGGPDRIVRLDPRLTRALKALAKASGGRQALLFPVPDGRPAREVIRRFWQAVRATAGVPCRFHDLRHTYASVMAARVPLRDVQRALGHASIRMTERYAHFAKDAAPSLSIGWNAGTRTGATPKSGRSGDRRRKASKR